MVISIFHKIYAHKWLYTTVCGHKIFLVTFSWRRRWDSNPRYFSQYKRFRVVLVMTTSIRLQICQLTQRETNAYSVFLEPLLEPAKNSNLQNPTTPLTQSVLSSQKSNKLTTFRVVLVMTTSIRLHTSTHTGELKTN